MSSPTTSGSSVADSPSIASTSSSEGSSVGGTTVTIESSGLFSIVKSEILISETAKLSLTCNSLISTSIVSGIFSGVAVTSKLNNGCSTTPPSLAPTAY